MDRAIFDKVQDLLAANANTDKTKWLSSGALLIGKLYDDHDNRMRPSFTSKNGVRYRFYVNSALLGGRKHAAGSVRRVSAPEIEALIETAIRERMGQEEQSAATTSILQRIERVTLKTTCIEVAANISNNASVTDIQALEIPWMPNAKPDLTGVELTETGKLDPKLVQSIVRAHAWMHELSSGTHASIESLAKAVKLNPKVIRQALRLAFLAPATMNAILQGEQPAHLSLKRIPFTLPLSWEQQNQALAISR